MTNFGRNKEQYIQLAQLHSQEIIERRTCVYSSSEFPIYAGEVELLKKLSPKLGTTQFDLPLPVAAPHLRKLLRSIRKNERTLYYHTCDLTGKKSISRIHPVLGVPIYTNEAWASDDWESTEYGTQLHGSVFDTLRTLSWTTPYQDLIGSLSNTQTNALYTNYTADITDSYLVFDAHTIRNGYYLTKARRCDDCVDCVHVDDCQRCVGCYDSKGCHGCVGVARCSSCVSCRSIRDCVSCQDCIGCVGLQHKQYCVYNKQLTKEDYFVFKKAFIHSGAQLDTLERSALLSTHSSSSTVTFSENASGQRVRNSSTVIGGEDLLDCQDMRWCNAMSKAQDCIDVSSYGHESSRMAHCSQVGRYSNSLLGCVNIGKSEQLLYCIDVKKSRYCFGCVNMKEKEYCIFNIQYTKEEYFQKVPELIAMMKNDNSRGHFLPSECNVIVYNDSKANEDFPVAKVLDMHGSLLYENTEGNGVVTLQEEGDVAKGVIAYGGERVIPILRRTVPQSMVQGGDDVIDGSEMKLMSADIDYATIQSPIRCESSGRLFRIMKPELDIYKSLGCRLPAVHPDVRYERVKSL